MFERRKNLKIIFLLFVIFLFSGCKFSELKKERSSNGNGFQALFGNNPSQGGGATQSLSLQGKINKFDNLESLKKFMEENETNSNIGNSYATKETFAPMSVSRGMMATQESVGVADSFAGQKSADFSENGANTNNYSTTNVQVEGVDEADIVKTDGEYIYAIAKNSIFLAKANPVEKAEVVSKIEFKSNPSDLYVSGNKLVVYGSDNELYATETYSRFIRKNAYSFFKIFDISDKKNPKQIKDLKFEGVYTNSRLIGDYVYFVTSNYQYYIANEPLLPRILENEEVYSNDKSSGKMAFVPDIYYFDVPYNSYNFTSIYAININESEKNITGDVYVMNNNQNMYVSQNNIYITYTKYISEFEIESEVTKELIFPNLSQVDKDKISKIESVENYILTKDEKINKISEILYRHISALGSEEAGVLEKKIENAVREKYRNISKELEKTVIHKIAISKDQIEYKQNGEVSGYVLNQFSMDENNGYFRIATTKNSTWSRYLDQEEMKSYSNLYVLDENLKTVGSVEGLAKDERIYSVRFMQDRAYLVTFEQVDPLFVVDLKDPQNPKILGELKIPGFSNYLHPYDNDTLIGIGKDTYIESYGGVRTKGVKISLFDVSDVSSPKEIDAYVLGDEGSDSLALTDHKAFLFSKEKNLLSIPVTVRKSQQPGDAWGEVSFVGAAIFNVDKEKGIELRGEISHNQNSSRRKMIPEFDYYDTYDNTIKRSLYIEDKLYTLSDARIKINDLSDLKELGDLELKKEKSEGSGDFEVIN